MGTAEGIAALRRRYPWPAQRPPLPATEWGWGIAGEAMLREHVPADAACILEIGSLLGASARYFARLRPQADIICVDPWNDVNDRPLLRRAPELAPYLNDRKDGIYELFLASTWELRERLVPIRGYSPEALRPVYDAGVRPDLIYVDGSHAYEDVLVDLHCCQMLFPAAVLSGDDWRWRSVREAVLRFAGMRGCRVAVDANTWVVQVPAGGMARQEGRAARSAAARVAEWLLPARRAVGRLLPGRRGARR